MTDGRLRQLATHLHGLGVRPLYHFLAEIKAGKDVEQHLERYGRLDAAVVKILDGDTFDVSHRRPGPLQ